MALTRGYCLIFIAISVFCWESEAARRIDLTHPRYKRSLHIREENPDELFGLRHGEHLVPGNKIRTAAGTTKVKMQETYKGIPIVGEGLVLEVDEDGRYTGDVSGQLLEEIEDDVPSIHPLLSNIDALQVALKYKGHNMEDISIDPDKDIVLQINVEGIKDIRARLVYNLNYRIENRRTTSRPTFIIDANSGDIIKDWDAISMASWKRREKRRANDILKYKLVDGNGGNKKIGKHVYGLDLPELRVQSFDNGTCSLENQYALIYNCNNSYSCLLDSLQPHHFDCEEGNEDEVNGAYSPLNDALFYVGITYEMYADWYEISDPLKTQDLNGGRCIARIHYGQSYENAFWDGSYITFGDGESMMYPLTSLNVVAHEISHGFTEKNSGLIYSGESGGMNEAFSDMAGEAAEDYLKHKIDWMVGFSIWKPENESMRYFDDPTRDGRSIGDAEDMCFMMDPHQSSGVYNKVFYTLSNTPGWCVRKAFHVFVIANDMYWKPETGFNDGACDVLKATKDLGYSEDDVNAAFMSVGIEPCKSNFKNALGNMLMLENDTTLHFEISNDLDEELDYTNAKIIVTSRDLLKVTVETPFYTYTVDRPSNYRHSRYPAVVELGRQCYKESCSISLYAPMETMAIVVPVATFKTLVGGMNLYSNDTIDMGETSDNSTDDFEFNIVHMLEFELPNFVIENKVTVLVVPTVAKGRGTFAIRHGLPPNKKSREADQFGDISRRDTSGSPTWLCSPREGKYYMIISLDEDIIDLRIELAAWLVGSRKNTKAMTTEAPSSSIDY